ncbi:MAG: zinc-ribbon domain-containing protein [Acidobacteria bacterium]|nr:zinc-ribbon domain-containing protein [Acidobacteriota bacterium]
MFCPRCGQQAAEEVRFCSRCGLPLDAAAGLVAAGDGSAQPESARANVGLTPRQRGMRKGLMITAGGVFFFVIVAILSTIKDDFLPVLLFAGLIITVGVMRMLYGFLLEEHAPAGKTSKQPAELPRERERAAELPPARAVPANVYAKPGAQTSDMAAPPSVTESTTRLLDEDEAGRRT